VPYPRHAMDTPVERVVADGLGGRLAILGRGLLPRLLLLLTLLVSFHLGVFGFLLLPPLSPPFLSFLEFPLEVMESLRSPFKASI
jgi:hypothetical protein